MPAFRAAERLRGRVKVEFVVPDYYAKYPKPCMGGWGRKVLLVKPNGDVLIEKSGAQKFFGFSGANLEGADLFVLSQKANRHTRLKRSRCEKTSEIAFP